MKLQTDTSAGLRRAALALHSMGPADRQWLLKQLPRPNQQILEELLSELKALGIPPDGAVISAALQKVAGSDPVAVADARSLCLVLADEPPVLQSVLLAALPEAGRSAVLLHWPHEVLARPSAVNGQAWTPALRDAVMQSWRELGQSRREESP